MESLRRSLWIGRPEARVRELGPEGEALLDDLLGGGALEHALPSLVVGRVEALEQGLEVGMVVDGDPEHLTLHPPVEALDHAIGLGCIGPCLAVLHLDLAAGFLESLGREARAAVGEHMCDLEGESADCLLEEGDCVWVSSSS